MSTKKSKFRIMAVHSNGSHTFFYRPTLQSCIFFIRKCLVNFYPEYGSVSFHIQEYRKSFDEYFTFITTEYYYSDLPF